MKTIKRHVNVKNLVRELVQNKIESLEILREALSNAKDHQATRVWIRSFRDDHRNRPSLLFIDNGEGMNEKRLGAFWGVGDSQKPEGVPAIGYKGHGTKLYFACRRLSVATKTKNGAAWQFSELEHPADDEHLDISVGDLRIEHLLYTALSELKLLEQHGTAVLIEHIEFDDAAKLLQRLRVESYCDWFTVIGDIRSGLFDKRKAFHETLEQEGEGSQSLWGNLCALRPIRVDLRINGERRYTPLGLPKGTPANSPTFYGPWHDDFEAYKERPEMLAFGHRFADFYESKVSAKRVRDDSTSLCLTSPKNWKTEDGYGIIVRVEGYRRQRDTYYEADIRDGVFSLDKRFGLWLCRDFVPIVQRNDLLQEALQKASEKKASARPPLQFEMGRLRNWQVFINHRDFLPTANRASISRQLDQSDYEIRVVDVLSSVLERAFEENSFRQWVARLRNETLRGQRKREIKLMDDRREDVRLWIDKRKPHEGIEPMAVELPVLPSKHSLLMREPASEQELFYVYALLSGRYEMPLHVLEYSTTRGVDAIGRSSVMELSDPRSAHPRLEFKHTVSAQNPISHFFDAIDVLVCWRVERTGDIYEQSSGTDTVGKLRARAKPVLVPAIDAYEIAYESEEHERERVIAVLELERLFRSGHEGKPAGKERGARGVRKG